MTTITQPLRDEHASLVPHIQTLREVADRVTEISIESLRQEIDGAHRFLTDHLIPHAEVEDRVLYPVVGEALGAPEATATMRRDHVEVGRLTAELGTLRARLGGTAVDPGQAKELRRVLYGLYALVTVHFAKEEEIYLAILDQRLSAQAARELFAAMEHAAGHCAPSSGGSTEQAGSIAMVVCVPVAGEGLIGPRWGRAERVAIVELAGRNILHWREHEVGWNTLHDTVTEGSHHARVARFLRDHRVDAVIARHMGADMAHMLERMGIRVHLGAGGSAREAATAIGAEPEGDPREAEREHGRGGSDPPRDPTGRR